MTTPMERTSPGPGGLSRSTGQTSAERPTDPSDVIATVEPSGRRLVARRAVIVATMAALAGTAVASAQIASVRSGADGPRAAEPAATAPVALASSPAPATTEAPSSPAPAAAHDRFTVGRDPAELDLLANDTTYGDVELTITEPPSAGRIDVDGEGRVTFDPAGLVGDAVFTYQLCSDAGCDSATVAVASVPAGASRLAPHAPVRVIDTRDGAPPAAGTPLTFPVDGSPSAIAVAVSVMGTVGAGEVTVEAGAGPVVAAGSGGPGSTTTNTVIVGAASPEVTVTSSAGGHVVVDVVGTFEPSQATAAGRFVSTGAITVGRLVTAEEGRSATFDLTGAVAGGSASAVLALITADVGNDGGMIRLGPEPGSFDQMLMWGPPAPDDRLRQGLVLLVPSAEGEVALRYDGGSVLTIDVVGYFTDEAADPGYSGLLVATEPTPLFDGTVPAGRPVTIDDPTGIARDFFVVRRASGRTVSTVLPATEGGLQLGAGADLDISLDLLAVFL